MASESGMDVPGAKENNNETGSSSDENGNTDVFSKIRSLFGDDIYESLQSKS